MVVHDQTRAPLAGDLDPHPLNEDADARVGPADELEVHGHPGEPREEAADSYAAGRQDGEPLANHGHVPFVEVSERAHTNLMPSLVRTNHVTEAHDVRPPNVREQTSTVCLHALAGRVIRHRSALAWGNATTQAHHRRHWDCPRPTEEGA